MIFCISERSGTIDNNITWGLILIEVCFSCQLEWAQNAILRYPTRDIYCISEPSEKTIDYSLFSLFLAL